MEDILGFFAMMFGTLMDPIALPCYIASGLFIKKYGVAVAASIGLNIVFHVVFSAIQKSQEGGAETGSPDMEVLAASLVGAVAVTSFVFLIASKSRQRRKLEAQKDENTPDAS
jgi:hypothetical protein